MDSIHNRLENKKLFSELEATPSEWSCSALEAAYQSQAAGLLARFGFVVVSDIEVSADDLESAERTALHFARQFGQPMWQDDLGKLVWTIRNEDDQLLTSDGKTIVDVRSGDKSSKSQGAIWFHADGAPGWLGQEVDLMAMLAVRVDATGGDTILLDTHSLFAALLSESPETVGILSQPIPFNRTGNTLPEQSDVTWLPMFSWDRSELRVRLNTVRARATMRDNPSLLNDDVIVALHMVEKMMSRPEFQLRLHLEPNQCLMTDERRVAHSRTTFTDPNRVLLRVWLHQPRPHRSVFGWPVDLS